MLCKDHSECLRVMKEMVFIVQIAIVVFVAWCFRLIEKKTISTATKQYETTIIYVPKIISFTRPILGKEI